MCKYVYFKYSFPEHLLYNHSSIFVFLFIFHLCVFRFKYFSVTFGIIGSIRGMFYQVKKVVKCQAENQPLLNCM